MFLYETELDKINAFIYYVQMRMNEYNAKQAAANQPAPNEGDNNLPVVVEK